MVVPPSFDTPGYVEDLLRRVASHDREAFATLYATTSAKLYGIVIRILNRRAIADEVLQDVFVKIWSYAGDYNTAKGSAIAWMASIARNRAIDEIRRITPLPLDDTPDALAIPIGGPDALEALSAKQEAQRLIDCMSHLDKERREMVMLAYFDGFSRAALAARFGHPISTIKTWLHRSTAQLRDCVEK